MVFLNYTTMQMTAKIVYYGPGLCGKTTNLQHIHDKTASKSRGEMVSLETESDRTLFFDLLPLDVGVVGGMKVRLQLYTVPGQVFYNATRKLVLKNVDGVVFVADSQEPALDANLEALANLDDNLAELGLSASEVPTVFQYNKRDLPTSLPVADLERELNPRGLPSFEAAALHGVGVFETLKSITKLTLQSIRAQASAEAEPRKIAPAPPKTPPLPEAPRPQPDVAPEPASPLESLVTGAAAAATPPAGTEEPVEFAEEDTGDVTVRPVKTMAQPDIQRELRELRETSTGPTKDRRRSPGRRSDDLHPVLIERPELRRRTRVLIPPRLLQSSQSVRMHLAFETPEGEEVVEGVVKVALPDGSREHGLRIEFDLDLRTK
jgi:signal recognition particle receptor subunit beta